MKITPDTLYDLLRSLNCDVVRATKEEDFKVPGPHGTTVQFFVYGGPGAQEPDVLYVHRGRQLPLVGLAEKLNEFFQK